MIVVINPNTKIDLNCDANILLGYSGQNFDLNKRKTFKPAKFHFQFSENNKNENYSFSLEIDFIQFQNVELKLNFYNGKVENIDEGNKEIGEVELKTISLGKKQMIISGKYRHDSINLAWHNEDIVNFDCIIDLTNLKIQPTFITRMKAFKIKNNTIGDKIKLFDYD